MTMRHLAAACMLLAFPSGAAAGPPRGATIRDARLNSNGNSATIRIVNSSNKDISAYVISVNVGYANGETNYSELLVDLLPLMMTKLEESAASSLRDGAFRAGETRSEVAAFKADPRNPAARVDADVVAVVYSDQTAEAQSEGALSRIVAVGNGIALARRESADIINRSLGDAEEAHPSAAAAAGVRKLLLHEKKEHSGELQTELLAILDDLQRAPDISLQSGTSERDYLSQYAASAAQRATIALAHARIRREP